MLTLGWRRTPQQRLLAAARRLAADVHIREAAELTRLIGDTGNIRPAELEFTQPPLLYWRTDGGAQRGSLSQIQAYYQQLGRGRLIVQGPAGAGKTVLAIALTCELTAAFLRTQPTETPAYAAGGPVRERVAVRISASTFDPTGGTPLSQLDIARVAARLQDWLAAHLQTVYGLRERDAVGLVTGGWILPVIDGVDEMDPPAQPPRRADALIAALNHPTRSAIPGGGWMPVVLTCRAIRHTDLAAPRPAASSADPASRGDDMREPLQDATLVHVEPLTPAAVRDYLLFRFPDPAGTQEGQPRWRPILNALNTPAAAVADDPGLHLVVGALRSPLRLFLAIDGYRDPTSYPGALARFSDSASLDAHLFARLIPSAIRLHPRPAGGSYNPEHVHTWLATLARHLADGDCAGRSGTDLRLDELWRAAGPRLARYLTAVILALAIAAPVLWLEIRYLAVVGGILDFWGLAFASLAGWGAWRASRIDTDLQRLDLRLFHSRRGRLHVVAGVVAGLVGGLLGVLTAWLTGAFVSGLTAALAVSLAVGATGGLVFGLQQRPQAIASPRQLATQGLTHAIANGMSWLAVGLAVGLMGGVNPTGGLVDVLALGLAFGLALGLGSSPWPRYLVTCVLLGQQKLLPRRPAQFLDWAYQAGMVRLAGLAVQFRHREFQGWLTATSPHDEPPPSGELGAKNAGHDD